MKFDFPIIIVDQDFRVDNISGSGMRALAEAIEAQGGSVVAVTQARDFLGLAQQSARASAFIVSVDEPENGEIELDEAKAQTIEDLRAMVHSIRARNLDIPIFLYGRTHTSRDLPTDVLREMHGFMNMFEDTNEFMARRVLREAKVAVAPGLGFGEHGDGFVRFALVENRHRIRQAVRNLKAFLGRYHNVVEIAEKQLTAAQ